VLGLIALVGLIAAGLWAAKHRYFGYRRVRAQADQASAPDPPHERSLKRSDGAGPRVPPDQR